MKAESVRLLDKAARSLRAAEILLDAGEVDFAAGRAYYAMFYAAEALLVEEELRFRKHAAVHAAFGERFALTGTMDRKFHRWLLDAFDRRIVGDYDTTGTVSAHEVRDTINQASEFISATTALLKQKP